MLIKTGVIYLVSDSALYPTLISFKDLFLIFFESGPIYFLNSPGLTSTVYSIILEPAKKWIVVDFPAPDSPKSNTTFYPLIRVEASLALDIRSFNK